MVRTRKPQGVPHDGESDQGTDATKKASAADLLRGLPLLPASIKRPRYVSVLTKSRHRVPLDDDEER